MQEVLGSIPSISIFVLEFLVASWGVLEASEGEEGEVLTVRRVGLD